MLEGFGLLGHRCGLVVDGWQCLGSEVVGRFVEGSAGLVWRRRLGLIETRNLIVVLLNCCS